MKPYLIRPDALRGIVTMKAAIDAVRTGFREWGLNPQINAPRRRIHIPTGVRVSVHQGGVPAAHATGLMTHCEWVQPMAEHQEYPRLNHPVIVLRTAATSAVGTDLLARPDAEKLGILGAGGQARNHLIALTKLRKLKEV